MADTIFVFIFLLIKILDSLTVISVPWYAVNVFVNILPVLIVVSILHSIILLL